jgi:serralysin
VTGAAVLPNPGPSWHVEGVADFNGDGKANILWQNDDGTPAIWTMNGTTVTGGAVLPTPSSDWHLT